MLMFSDPVLVIIVLGSVFVSAVLHEVMHAVTAKRLGDDTAYHMGRITLNPLKHIDPFLTILLPVMLALSGLPILAGAKPVPFNPTRVRWGDFGSALVSIAGPLTNLFIASLMGLWMRFFLDAQIGTELYGVLNIFVQVNIGLFVFNMIPFPPLDGSRVLYAFSPKPIQDILEKIEQYGFMGFILFYLLVWRYLSPIFGEAATFVYGLILG